MHIFIYISTYIQQRSIQVWKLYAIHRFILPGFLVWNQAHKAVVVMPMIGPGGVGDDGMPGNWHCIWKTFLTRFVDMFLCCFGVNQKEVWWIFLQQLRKEEFREKSTCLEYHCFFLKFYANRNRWCREGQTWNTHTHNIRSFFCYRGYIYIHYIPHFRSVFGRSLGFPHP